MAILSKLSTSNVSASNFEKVHHEDKSLAVRVQNGLALGRNITLARANDIMNERVDWTDAKKRSSKDVGPFFVADVAQVRRNYEYFRARLPKVEPHYAVKANPEDMILRLLIKAGSSFDCASVTEVEKVLSLGADPARIIWAHPRCSHEHIMDALSLGVKTFVFDSENDLDLAQKYYPDIRFVIRFAPDDSGAKCQLSEKFGSPINEVRELLQKAKTLELNVVGVSFHVGSDAEDPNAFAAAIRQAREVFDIGHSLGFGFKILDLGGGYTRGGFDRMAAAIRNAISTHFPDSDSIRIIGEPGRFFVDSAFVLAVRVIGLTAGAQRCNSRSDRPEWKVDLSDGLYGSLNNLLADHQTRVPVILRKQDQSEVEVTYLMWGPTCDSFDKPIKAVKLPARLQYGDWLYFEDMGAYTVPCSSEFNGNPKAKIIWTSTDVEASKLLGRKRRALLHESPKSTTKQGIIDIRASLKGLSCFRRTNKIGCPSMPRRQYQAQAKEYCDFDENSDI